MGDFSIVPAPPSVPRDAGALVRRQPQPLLPAIKSKSVVAGQDAQTGRSSRNTASSKGGGQGILQMHDLKAIKTYINANQKIPHQYRTGDLRHLIPDSSLKKNTDPVDQPTNLQLAPLPPLDSAIDTPLRFAPPAAYHAPELVDPKPSEPEVQKLFSFMKRSANPNGAAAQTMVPTPRDKGAAGVGESTKSASASTAALANSKKEGKHGMRKLEPRDYLMRAQTCKRAGEKRKEAIAYFNTAAIYYTQTEYEKAIDMLGQCVAVLEKLSDRAGLACSQNLLGVCYFRLGKIKTAVHHYKKQEVLCGNYGRAIAQVNIGVAYSALGELAYASQAFHDAVENSRMTQDLCVESIALGNLGLAYLRSGNLRGAQENFESCMELCALGGDEAGAAVCLLLLGEVYSVVRDYKRAQFYYSNALRVAIDGNVKDVEQMARVNLGISKGNDQYNAKCSELVHSMGLITNG